MEKLFTDAETFTKVRPTKITEQQAEDFYKTIAEEIIENGWSDSDLEDVISDVKNISTHHSGYKIAKDLEGFGSKASYDIDTPFIEFLDSYGYEKDCVLRKNVEAWVAAHNPQPKFNKGQKLLVAITLNHENKKDAIVYVIGFSEKQACYLIDKNPERQGGTVITYEKVETNCNPL
jgi:hypothetical protein